MKYKVRSKGGRAAASFHPLPLLHLVFSLLVEMWVGWLSRIVGADVVLRIFGGFGTKPPLVATVSEVIRVIY